MSEYWIEIHPESPAHIVLCDNFLSILKRAGFNDELDSQILSTGNGYTIVVYKNEYPDKQKSKLVGNQIREIGYTDISKVYKKAERIPLAFEQDSKDFGTNFDVFVIDVLSEKNKVNKNESEDLGDIFI